MPKTGFSDHTLVKSDGTIAAKVAILKDAALVERHFTILPANQSKDGPVSIGPKQMSELKQFSELSKSDMQAHLDDIFPDWHRCLGKADRALSNEEILNRDYYRGRFATPVDQANSGQRMIDNWDEVDLC